MKKGGILLIFLTGLSFGIFRLLSIIDSYGCRLEGKLFFTPVTTTITIIIAVSFLFFTLIPSRETILTVLAVESGYDVKALERVEVLLDKYLPLEE